ncbi:hypothetical protein RAS1_36170 [Phycisphaerae bacterium RAS1]|nr:hypothetical protein RAS1_36170 [Phycisphaerae bacterium RAS1]
MTYQDFIVRDPKICGGQPVLRGTRVTLRTILASLAAGDTVEAIMKAFPTLTREHLNEVVAFAAAAALHADSQPRDTDTL